MEKKRSSPPDNLKEQIELIRSAMIKAGVWSNEIPQWIETASPHQIPDVWQWLQYIYLPMRINDTWYKPHYIAPVISPYLDTTPELKQILQLVIELDSISSTLDKT